MNPGTTVLAHAESGPIDLAAVAFVVVIGAGAAIWLVRIIRQLDNQEDPLNDSARPPALGWVLISGVVVVLAVAGFLVLRAQSDTPSFESQGVVNDLCRAADQASSDPSAALATFNGAPHDALHGLETDLRKEDPLAAQRLTTAKSAAEKALIARNPNSGELTTTLAAETAAAYRIVEPAKTITSCG